ncbi:MAG: U32 family peptidase, partial [Lachnospiraceae bacterium]|nr:U32 family peptidase [Lachnospiraceae bacterium]
MNKLSNKLELLSPAGSFECAKAAIDAGADAIYMGGAKYGARAFAKSTSDYSIIDSINFAKENGKKFYLTVNTLFKQRELKEIFLFLDPIVDMGVDAFIVQDLGVAMLLKNKYPNVELHASTQMTITSSKAINLIKSLGFTQVVLARELGIKEIKAIKKEVGDDIKLEAFVHGSMCYSYSGACLMSSFIGGESGNRGRCKGPCRLPYRRGEVHEPAPYILSMKDMCALNSLSGLVNAGVTSFKIEGRMRQADYVYGVTKTYRKYLDAIINQQPAGDESDIKNDEKYLLQLYNKGGFTNYYDTHNSPDMIQR